MSFAQSFIHYSSVAAKLVSPIVMPEGKLFYIPHSIGGESAPVPDQWAAGVRGLSVSFIGWNVGGA